MFGKKKQAKPSLLTKEEQDGLKKVKGMAKTLDTALSFGPIKIGLDPIIGLVPVAGDVVTLALAIRLIHACQKFDLPKGILHQMWFNVAVDFSLGFIPVVGDIGDFLFKCNTKNAQLFEDHLNKRAAYRESQREKAAAEASTTVTIPPPPPIRR
ncbi:hypothetical protein B0O80DRAFT_430280 [Mortierella sp. GBAus27b]|nr:hypothetical protein BGX31_006021 [Mortierella sp. GBA43]KAI8347434.1 hypothetical protein B0O80DRAFT_430280 [Mortierella sp. GBAus27b]